MTITRTPNLLFDSFFVFGIGALVVALMFTMLCMSWSDERRFWIVVAPLVIAGIPMVLIGDAHNNAAFDRMNAQFADQLQEQYSATSDQSYLDLLRSRDSDLSFIDIISGREKRRTDAVFERDGKKVDVVVVFGKKGELEILDDGGKPYKPVSDAS